MYLSIAEKKLESVRNPARIPPQTPPAGGKRAEAGRIHSPRQIVSPCLVRISSATCPNTWRAEHQRKMSFPFSKEISPPPNQESKEHFSLVSAEALRGGGGTVHSSSGLVSKYIRTLSNKHRQKMKSGSEAKIWSARSAVCSESPQKILNLKGFATLRVAPRLPIQFYE